MSCLRWMYTALYGTAALCSLAIVIVVATSVSNRKFDNPEYCRQDLQHHDFLSSLSLMFSGETIGRPGGGDANVTLSAPKNQSEDNTETLDLPDGVMGASENITEINLCWARLLLDMGTHWFWYDELWIVTACCMVLLLTMSAIVVQFPKQPPTLMSVAPSHSKNLYVLFSLLVLCFVMQTIAHVCVWTQLEHKNIYAMIDSTIKLRSKSYLIHGMEKYQDAADVKHLWDRIQTVWQCCGVSGPEDWNPYDNVPGSCTCQDVPDRVTATSGKTMNGVISNHSDVIGLCENSTEGHDVYRTGCLGFLLHNMDHYLKIQVDTESLTILCLSIPFYISCLVTIMGAMYSWCAASKVPDDVTLWLHNVSGYFRKSPNDDWTEEILFDADVDVPGSRSPDGSGPRSRVRTSSLTFTYASSDTGIFDVTDVTLRNSMLDDINF